MCLAQCRPHGWQEVSRGSALLQGRTGGGLRRFLPQLASGKASWGRRHVEAEPELWELETFPGFLEVLLPGQTCPCPVTMHSPDLPAACWPGTRFLQTPG